MLLINDVHISHPLGSVKSGLLYNGLLVLLIPSSSLFAFSLSTQVDLWQQQNASYLGHLVPGSADCLASFFCLAGF